MYIYHHIISNHIQNHINEILRICFTRIWLKDFLPCLKIFSPSVSTERSAFQLLHRQGGEDEDRLKAPDLIRCQLLATC